MRFWKEMYFWNVDALVKDFKENKITEQQKMRYYLLFSLALALGNIPQTAPRTSTFSASYFDWISFWAEIIIVILGTIWCFQANSQGDNKDFISRITCLSLPVGMRIGIVFGILFVIGYLIFHSLGIERSLFCDVSLLTLSVGCSITSFVWIRSHLLYISSTNE